MKLLRYKVTLDILVERKDDSSRENYPRVLSNLFKGYTCQSLMSTIEALSVVVEHIPDKILDK